MTTPTRSEGFDPALRRLALVVILGAIMTILDTTIVNVAINTLGHDFKTSLSTIQWVLTGYMLALSMSIPLTGWAVERFGAKSMWLTSLLLFITGSVLCGVAWNVGSLVAFRVIQGLGAGMIMPIGQSMLAREAGPQRMGRVMSVIAVPAMLAPVLGPTIGGLILDYMSWRWMFYVNVPFCAVALIAAVKLLPADGERNTSAKLDVLGLLMLSPGLAALVYGIAEWGSGTSLTSPKVLITAVGGVALVTAFVLHALRKGEKALVNVRLYTNRTFTAANSALFVYVGALFGVMALLPLYFQIVRGYSPLKSGLMVAPMGLGSMLAMSIAGKLSDKMGARPLAYCGLPIMLLGVLGYTQLHADTSIPFLLVLLFIVGLGQGTMMPALMGGSYQTLERKDIASATTVSNVGMRIGGSFGVAILTVLLQHYFQNLVPGSGGSFAAARSHGDFAHIAPLLAHAFRDTFWWTLAIAAASVVPIAFIGKKIAAPSAPAERVEVPEDTPAAHVEI